MQRPLAIMLPTRLALSKFISSYWLVAGYLCLLTGLFWLPEISPYTKVYYAAFAAPALLGLLLAPRNMLALLREPIILAFLALAAWLLASLYWTTSDSNSISLAKRPLYVFMLFAGCALIAMRDQALLLKTLYGAAIVASLVALVSVAYFLLSESGARMVGYGALRNALLSSHVFGFFLAFWICLGLSHKEKAWQALLAALPLAFACLATGSRTPLLAMVVVLCWMLLFCWKRAGLLLAGILALAVLSLLIDPQILLQRGVSYRPQLWAEALRQALETPWLGHGYDSRFVFDIPGRRGLLSDPHNIALAVLLELGLVGLLAWITMHGLALGRCLRQRHLPSFQLASALLVYGLTAGLTEGSSFLARPNESWFIIWIPLALIAALSITQRGLANK
ncbi:O-antigen ligase family protein [Pseudomonas sp. Gutcm_11s]|uniref:O-antigen ligase family protein n=1 Tax=Pseudomonas sp. Gutcm_11s TaxID=3026088 RepID=UPI0023602001|nr:O-antigen ligase family protein [Pseudomonas sp. Gutcm_11s]MDD0842934.1 O-antigen ligase family protein [Pseudomonas sp. Gutcm_11s]